MKTKMKRSAFFFSVQEASTSRAVAELAAKMFQSLKYSATVHHLTKHVCECPMCQKGPSVAVIQKITGRFLAMSNSEKIQTKYAFTRRAGMEFPGETASRHGTKTKKRSCAIFVDCLHFVA